jgi:hypothetical protein
LHCHDRMIACSCCAPGMPLWAFKLFTLHSIGSK